jgi:uncharacterized protein YcnI
MLKTFIPAIASVVLATSTAFAHITLESQQASIGGGYKAVFKVPHGCKGSDTVKIRVQIPNGVLGVKPQPKSGWQLEVVKGRYDKAYDFYHGAKVEEGVKEVVWSGGKLPDAFYDEFVMQGFLADSLKPGTMLYFPVVQECEQGVDRWIEIPAEGKRSGDYPAPAPGLKLLPKQGGAD